MVPATAEAPSDRRALLALRLAPALMIAVFALVGTDLLLFDTAVAISLAAAVWVVYELHDHQRATDEHLLQSVREQSPWPAAEPHEARNHSPELLTDSRFG